MAEHNDLGEKGEQLAADYLVEHGYQIIEKNYRHHKAEVDIIAKKGNTLAVVEVKTRSTDFFGNPEEFVNQKKIKLLVSAINHYVVERNLDVEVRFDIIAIINKKSTFTIEHLEDAFYYF